MQVIAFGDIHGYIQAAESDVSLAERLGVKAVFLGDYIDRGPSGIKTIQSLIRTRAKHPDWIFLRGNHEQMLMDLIVVKHKPDDLGILTDGSRFNYSESKDAFEEWEKLPDYERRAITGFLMDTEMYYETTPFIFVHAVLRDTGQEIVDKSAEELLWNYSYYPEWQGKTFIHGHRLTDNVTRYQRGININTKCGFGGFCSGALLDMNDGEIKKIYKISETGSHIHE